MAIIVPFVASAMGATALQATLVAVAFSVTGISAKIDKAASKVFGKDLVMLGNVLGAGYAMFNRGFDVGGGADTIGPATDAAGNLTSAPEISSSAWDATGAANASAIEAASAGAQPMNLSDMAAGFDDGSFFGGGSTASVDSTNMLTNTSGITDGKAPTTTAPADGALKLTSSTSQPQGTGAASAQATAGNATAAQATDQIVPNATQAKAAADVLSKQLAPYQQPSNIFERLMYTTDKAGNRVFNDRLAGGVIQGLGSAASGYMQSQEAAKGLDWQKQKYGARIGGRITG